MRVLVALITVLVYQEIYAVAKIEREQCPVALTNALCGFLRVPLNKGDPGRGTVSLHFARILPNTTTTNSSALIILTGGPGLSLINLPPPQFTSGAELFQRPIIFVDYRGMGLSDALLCRTLQETNSPFPLTAEKVANCMTEIGPRVLQYNSAQIANDIEALRVSLKYDTLDLYGESYGAVILQSYVSKYSRRVRTAVLDSPTPLRRDVTGVSEWPVYQRIYELRGVNVTQFHRDIDTVLQRLRNNDSIANLTPELLADVYQQLPESLPAAVSIAASSERYHAISALINSSTQQPPTVPPQIFSYAASIGVTCNDYAAQLPWSSIDPPDVRKRSAQLAISQLPEDVFAPFHRDEAITKNRRLILDPCTGFPFPQPPPTTLRPPGRLDTVTFYGQLDTSTPLENRPDLDELYQNRVIIIPATGHVVRIGNPCAFGLIVEFVTSRKIANESVCS